MPYDPDAKCSSSVSDDDVKPPLDPEGHLHLHLHLVLPLVFTHLFNVPTGS